MNILISNDDGIAANGIRALTEELSKCHNVYVVAPDRERSAAGHSLTLHTPLRVEEIENPRSGAKRTWVTNGTPGDCVKLGINAILSPEEQKELEKENSNVTIEDLIKNNTVKAKEKDKENLMNKLELHRIRLENGLKNEYILNIKIQSNIFSNNI